MIKTDVSINRMWLFEVGFLTVLFFIFISEGQSPAERRNGGGVEVDSFIKTTSHLPVHLILFISSETGFPLPPEVVKHPFYSLGWYQRIPREQSRLSKQLSTPPSAVMRSFLSYVSGG